MGVATAPTPTDPRSPPPLIIVWWVVRGCIRSGNRALVLPSSKLMVRLPRRIGGLASRLGRREHLRIGCRVREHNLPSEKGFQFGHAVAT
jgi:hypothetical protein